MHTLTTAPAPRPDRQAGTGTPEQEGRLPEAAPGHSVRPWPVVRATDAIWPPVSLLEGVPDVTPHSRLWLPGSSPGSSPASPGAGLQVCSIVTPLPELPPYPQLPGAWVPWQGYGQGGCPARTFSAAPEGTVPNPRVPLSSSKSPERGSPSPVGLGEWGQPGPGAPLHPAPSVSLTPWHLWPEAGPCAFCLDTIDPRCSRGQPLPAQPCCSPLSSGPLSPPLSGFPPRRGWRRASPGRLSSSHGAPRPPGTTVALCVARRVTYAARPSGARLITFPWTPAWKVISLKGRGEGAPSGRGLPASGWAGGS